MPQEQSTLPIGAILRERYLIKNVLGSGNNGAVYLVKDQQIKRLKYNLSVLKEITDLDEHERYQFTFNSVALRQLQHPALPRIRHAFNDNKRSRVYLVMDYVTGLTLEKRLQLRTEKLFSWTEMKTLIEPIIMALIYLHQQEKPFFHGDIKPVNLIQSETGKMMLVDPCYVQLPTSTHPRIDPLATHSCYRAPEYVPGKIDDLSDIYGLGATLYMLLTGQTPIDALTRIKNMGKDRPDPLKPANEVASGVSSDLAKALQRALALDPDERFASIKDFWQALSVIPTGAAMPAEELSEATKSASVADTSSGLTEVTIKEPTDITDVPIDSTSTPTEISVTEPASVSEAPADLTKTPTEILVTESAPVAETPADLTKTPTEILVTESAPAARVSPRLASTPQTIIKEKPASHSNGTPNGETSLKRKKRGVGLARVAIICAILLLLISAGAGFWASIHNNPSPSLALASPTVSIATRPTTATSGPTNYSNLLGSYTGIIYPLNNASTSPLSLIIRQQQQNQISGTFHSSQQTGVFSGTVDKAGAVQFTVQDASGKSIFVFSGGLNGSPRLTDSMGGTFYGCTATSGSNCQPSTNLTGTWTLNYQSSAS